MSGKGLTKVSSGGVPMSPTAGGAAAQSSIAGASSSATASITPIQACARICAIVSLASGSTVSMPLMSDFRSSVTRTHRAQHLVGSALDG